METTALDILAPGELSVALPWEALPQSVAAALIGNAHAPKRGTARARCREASWDWEEKTIEAFDESGRELSIETKEDLVYSKYADDRLHTEKERIAKTLRALRIPFDMELKSPLLEEPQIERWRLFADGSYRRLAEPQSPTPDELMRIAGLGDPIEMAAELKALAGELIELAEPGQEALMKAQFHGPLEERALAFCHLAKIQYGTFGASNPLNMEAWIGSSAVEVAQSIPMFEEAAAACLLTPSEWLAICMACLKKKEAKKEMEPIGKAALSACSTSLGTSPRSMSVEFMQAAKWALEAFGEPSARDLLGLAKSIEASGSGPLKSRNGRLLTGEVLAQAENDLLWLQSWASSGQELKKSTPLRV